MCLVVFAGRREWGNWAEDRGELARSVCLTVESDKPDKWLGKIDVRRRGKGTLSR